MDNPTPKFPGMVHPKDSMARASAYFQVGPFSGGAELVNCPFGGACLVHCHGVDFRGGFAIFWVVSPQGLKRELWATNKVGLEVRQFDLSDAMSPHIPECFGVFTWSIGQGMFGHRKGKRFEDSVLWREIEGDHLSREIKELGEVVRLATTHPEMQDLLLPLLEDPPKDSGCHGDPAKTRTF